MEIVFDCPCGRSLKIRDEKLRGPKVKCPACGALVDVPRKQAKEEKPVPEQSSPEPVKEKISVPENKPSSTRPAKKEETPRPEKKRSSRERKSRSRKRPQRRGRRDYDKRSGKGLQPQEMKPRIIGGAAGLAGGAGAEKDTGERKAGSKIAAFFRRIFGKR